MSYARFGLMILTSTAVMLGLMYLNTYSWEHLFFSETRLYMALLMGATMALIMLAFMMKMYADKRINIAIFSGAAVIFALCLWLVRSQATVSGTSYMRAMIPHHSIAVLTSERAQIRDRRVDKLAGEIIQAQRREIAEMRHLIADVSGGRVVDEIYQDPPSKPGTMEDALNNTLISTLDPAPMPKAEADRVLEAGARCVFNRSLDADPILWMSENTGAGTIKLNGVLLRLKTTADTKSVTREFAAPGVTVTVQPLGDEVEWRSEADLVFALEQGLRVGYRGFWACEG